MRHTTLRCLSRTKISSSDDNDISNSRRHLYDRNNNNAWETVRGLWKLTWRSPSSLWALGTWVIEYSACLFVGWSFVKEPSTRGRITTFILSSYLVFDQKRWDYSEFDDVFQHGARVCHEYAMGYRPACAPFFQLPFPSLMLLLLLQTYSQLSQTTEQGIHLCLYSQSQHI